MVIVASLDHPGTTSFDHSMPELGLDQPQVEESGFLSQYIPSNNHEYIVYPDAAYFSFMQLCKPGAIEMIEEEEPGDGIVCQDGNDRSRDELHQ